MTILRTLLRPMAAATFAFSPVAGQATSDMSFALKKCDDPKVAIGLLPRATGTVMFRMAKDGKPDTVSLAVLKVLGMSVAGFKSAAARTLSACRFDVGGAAANSSLLVTTALTTEGSRLNVGSATTMSDAGPSLPVEQFASTRDTMPLPFDDPRLEERPRGISCAGQVRAPTMIRATGSTPAEARANAQDQVRIASEQYNAANAGSLTALVRVSVDGKPGSQIKVIAMSNPEAAQALGDRIGSCRFAPGRVLGVLVPATMKMTMTNAGMAP